MNQQTCASCGHSDSIEESVCSKCGAVFAIDSHPTPSAATIQKGQVFANRYVVEQMIGKGGMGCIYRVHDNTLNETVALKTLLPEYVKEKQVVERFFNEARIARGLSHPHIVRVHDIGITDGMAYISMEMLEGRTLRSMLDKVQPGRRIPLNAILRMFDALCAALDYAHKYTIHRDIKPENVMVLPDGTIKLMDFGISKLMSNPSLTSASMVMGTPHYMSPEQLKNSANVDARADIYSVGVMLYETLTGDIPTGLSRENDTVREVPAALDPIIAKCCDRDPAKRYQSVAELRSALRAIRQQIETLPPESTPKPRKRSAMPSGALMKRGIAITLLAAIVYGATALWGFAESRRAERSVVTSDLSESGVTPTLAPVTKSLEIAETFVNMQPIAQRAKQNAASALLTMESEPHFAQASHLMNEAEEHWNLALESAGSDETLALREGWMALHRYLAIGQWPQDMAFVSEGEQAGPFFVDRQEVSADAFARFGESVEWRWPSEVQPGPQPMTHLTYYDVTAYLQHQNPEKVLPTQEQWSRILQLVHSPTVSPMPDAMSPKDVPDALPGWVGVPLDEWARADFKSMDARKWFGRAIPILGVAPDGSPAEIAPMLYEQSNPGVTFRGVWELPDTLTDVNRLLQ